MKTSGVIDGVDHQAAYPGGPGGANHEPAYEFSGTLGSGDTDGQGDAPSASRKPEVVRRLVFLIVVSLGVCGGIGFRRWCERIPATDQARVERDSYPVSSRLDGTVGKIFVSNRQLVKAGDLLVEIDTRELESVLNKAQSEANQAQTTIQAAAARLSRTQPLLEKAASITRHRERALDTAMLDYEFILEKRSKRGISPAQLGATRKAYETELSLYSQAKAALAEAVEHVQSDQDLMESSTAKLQSAEAIIRQTQRQLSYAKIYATVTGRVAFDKSKLVAPLRAGEVFVNLVGEPWVAAEFNESQRKRLKPGQPVRIRVSSMQGCTFRGRVESLAPPGRQIAATPMLVPKSSTARSHPLPLTPVKIIFDAESVRGFEERMDPGLCSSVEVARK